MSKGEIGEPALSGALDGDRPGGRDRHTVPAPLYARSLFNLRRTRRSAHCVRFAVGVGIVVAGCGGGLELAAAAASTAGTPGSTATVYVANFGSSSVTPVGVPTGIASRPISMHGLAPVALAAAPDGRTVYVVGVGSDEDGSPGSVIAINTRTRDLANPMTVGSSPQAILITPDGKTAYVLGGIDAATTPSTTPVTVTPIETATGIGEKAIKVGTLPREMVMSPNGKLIYVLDGSPSGDGKGTEITPVQTATNRVGRPIEVAAEAVAFAPDSATAYATSSLLGVVPIDTATGRPGKPVRKLPAVPIDIAVSPDGKHVEVLGTPDPGLEAGSPEGNNWTLTSIDVAGDKVGAVARLGANIGASSGIVAVAPNGEVAYVLVENPAAAGSIVIPVNLSTDTVGKAIPVGANAVAMAIASSGAAIYVLDGGSYRGVGAPNRTTGRLVQISTASNAVSRSTPVGLASLAFAVAPTVPAVAPASGAAGVKSLIVTDTVKGQLVAAFAPVHQVAVGEVAGTDPGSVFYAYDEATGTYWAAAFFFPAASDTPSVKETFQDAGSNGIFSRAANGRWRFRGAGAPLLCVEEHVVPKAVLAAWGIPRSSPACPGR